MTYSFSGDDGVPVVVHKVAKGDVAWSVANTRAGTVKACRRSHISPQIGGQISALHIQRGDRVQQGQLLLEMWNEDLKAQLQLVKDEAQVNKLVTAEVCLRAQNTAREAQRQQQLQSQNLSSEEQVDRAQTSAEAGDAACRAAKARVEMSAAQLQLAQAALQRTQLHAPFDAWVAEINGELGEFVTPSPPGIMTPPAVDLVDTSCLYIAAPIDEVDAPRIRTGLQARITLDAFAKREFQGEVRRIAPYVLELEKQARTVEVEAVFVNAAEYGELMPGYSADLEIIIDQKRDVLRIPTESILEGNRLYVLDDGVIESRQIEIGLANWRYTEVTSGLSAGELVVLSVDREGVVAGAEAQAEGLDD
jgi:HlyD family secretion protein